MLDDKISAKIQKLLTMHGLIQKLLTLNTDMLTTKDAIA